MEKPGEFRAGQRVRIRSDADSEFAGHHGVIMHVGTDVCDVRVRYKPSGSKVRSTYIGTFPKGDLESPHRSVDLAAFHTSRNRRLGSWWLWLCAIVAILVILAVLFASF